MYLFDFAKKLKDLNELLYVNIDAANRSTAGVLVSGIYLKKSRQSDAAQKMNLNYVDSDLKSLVSRAAHGEADTFLTGVCLNFVPEYDIYDLDRERLLMPGWRSILLQLVQKGICSLDKAKKVFKCRSLGEADWDRLSFPQRLQWSKGDRPERKF